VLSRSLYESQQRNNAFSYLLLQKQAELDKLRKELEEEKQFSTTLTTRFANTGMQLLQKKMYKEIHYRALPTGKPFITVSIPWVEDFQEVLHQIPVGTITQPLPNHRKGSPLTIKAFTTNEEVQQMFPDRLKREWLGGGWSILEAPLYISWSKTTNKLSAKFRYGSYLPSGLLSVVLFSSFPSTLAYLFSKKDSQQ
jgi:hypothetical protein